MMSLLALSMCVACSPMQGNWSGTCNANSGSWTLDLNLNAFSGDVEGAGQPSEWDAVRGKTTVSPAITSTETGTAALYLCDEFYAPCTFLEDGESVEVSGGYVRGDFTPDGDDEPAMRFIGEVFLDDNEIEGSCYNLVSGGAGVLNLSQ